MTHSIATQKSLIQKFYLYRLCPNLERLEKSDAVGNVLEIYSFSMESMTWTCSPGPGLVDQQKVEFTIEDIVFGKGGFRTAYKAISSYPVYNHTGWVVKKYLDECGKGNEGRAWNDYGRTYETNSSNACPG